MHIREEDLFSGRSAEVIISSKKACKDEEGDEQRFHMEGEEYAEGYTTVDNPERSLLAHSAKPFTLIPSVAPKKLVLNHSLLTS
jgi:hypothetical protein